jgi:hypothetical protein
MEEIKKWIARCENANIAPDDSDLEYARRKLEVLTLRKGYFTLLFFILLYTLADLYKYTRRQQT